MASGSAPTVAEACAVLLKNEDSIIFQRVTEALFKVLQNALQHPDEDKYRTLRRSNASFAEKIASAKGGIRFLKASGFVEQGSGEDTALVLPAAVSVEQLREAKASLKEIAKQRMDEEARKREEARRRDNELAAGKLAMLDQVSKQNQAKQTEAEMREKERLLEGIQIDREDRVRQKDPMAWK